MAHAQLTSLESIQHFLDQNGGVAVVDCFATWCGPCKAIAPFVTKMNVETGVPVITIDVDQAPELSEKYGVSAMPTFLVIQGKADNVVQKVVGGSQDNVRKMFQKAKTFKK